LILFGCFPGILTERIKPSAALIVEAAKAKAKPAVALAEVDGSKSK
jgi:hypothetical protein